MSHIPAGYFQLTILLLLVDAVWLYLAYAVKIYPPVSPQHHWNSRSKSVVKLRLINADCSSWHIKHFTPAGRWHRIWSSCCFENSHIKVMMSRPLTQLHVINVPPLLNCFWLCDLTFGILLPDLSLSHMVNTFQNHQLCANYVPEGLLAGFFMY